MADMDYRIRSAIFGHAVADALGVPAEFSTREELNCFNRLISVSGVGPKAALAVLSAMTPSQFSLAVLTGDEKTLTMAQGVGKKMAQSFSLGMKQRLGIALALINSPELLILDEPVNGLDPMGMVDVRELLRSLCEDDGITILISSHILAELYQLVTDYIIISHGQILETLSKEELDNKCSAYILLEAPETQAALKILTEHGIKSVSNENESIKIYDDVSIKDVAKWMFDANILVTLLMKYEKSLENYYMELLGGES